MVPSHKGSLIDSWTTCRISALIRQFFCSKLPVNQSPHLIPAEITAKCVCSPPLSFLFSGKSNIAHPVVQFTPQIINRELLQTTALRMHKLG